MKKNMFAQIGKRVLAFLLIFGMLGVYLPADLTLASDGKHTASFVERLENVLTTGDITKFFDNNVMFRLPEGIKDDQEISVIISLDTITIMDAYDKTNKTMSFKDYALYSDDAADIKAEIAERKAQILEKLDKKGVAYTIGEDYNTVISGFEIRIKAGDFTDTCKSLGCMG